LARQAGLAPGDVILQVGKMPVGSAGAFNAAARAYKSGDKVRLLVRNADSTGLVTVPVP
jgi:serine protease Do